MIGSFQSPSFERYVGIPLSVDMPAPVNATHLFFSAALRRFPDKAPAKSSFRSSNAPKKIAQRKIN
jgi:hypothetical protein